MSRTLVVKEYDTIVCNESLASAQGYIYLEEKYFRELEQFIKEYVSTSDEADILEFMKIGYKRGVGDTVTFNSYVGIIELPSGFQIEILPKVSLGEDDNNAKTKRIFLRMLNCLKDFDGKVFSSASLNADKMNLYEIFIRMYIQESWVLVKRGIKSDYISNEDNLSVYKGKLDVSKHITCNAAHKERFYMVFDEYQVNRPENKLIKSTLLKLLSITRNMDNAREIRQLLYSFELVDESANFEKDFSKVSLSRGMKEYELLIQWARIFLLNKSFTTFSGKNAGKALLFPMEQVFEAFIAKQVKTLFEHQSNGIIHVSTQDSGYYLFDEPRKFRLRPDIVVNNAYDEQHSVVIMDTKWKRLNSNPAKNYGISQADMYQMYAYSKKYQTPYIWLIYPMNDEVRDLPDIAFEAVKDEALNVSVRVFFVDLDSNHLSESLTCLYRKTYDLKFNNLSCY
jgi:5-methylcytosine-specific restriction enzyme subunit McrC